MRTSFSVEQHADVLKVGTDSGIALMDEIKEYAMRQSQERRILLFSAVLRVQIECMVRSVGPEATQAVLDAAVEHVRNSSDSRKA